MELPQDFKEFIQLLNEKEVKYLLVGGYAIVFYGYPRLTIDIDFWIEQSKDNAQKMISVLEDFFGSQFKNMTYEEFLIKDEIFRFGHVKGNIIDVLTSIEGMNFEDSYKNKTSINHEGLLIDTINKEDLIKNKLATGRLKDIADVDNLPE